MEDMNSSTLFSDGTIPDPYTVFFPLIGVSQPLSKTPIEFENCGNEWTLGLVCMEGLEDFLGNRERGHKTKKAKGVYSWFTESHSYTGRHLP